MQIEVGAIEEAGTDSLRNWPCKFRGNQGPGVDAMVQGESQQGCWGSLGADAMVQDESQQGCCGPTCVVPRGMLGLACRFAHLHIGHQKHP